MSMPLSKLHKKVIIVKSLYELVRNLAVIISMGVALYIFREVCPEYLLTILSIFIGIISYFCFSVVSGVTFRTVTFFPSTNYKILIITLVAGVVIISIIGSNFGDDRDPPDIKP